MKLKVNLQLSGLMRNMDLIIKKIHSEEETKKIKITRRIKDRMA